MLLPIPAPFRRRRGRPRARTAPTPPPVLSVTVLAVTRLDEQQAVWSFSAAVTAVTLAQGLLVGGQEPDAVEEITPEGWLRISYSGGVNVDDPWGIDPFPPVEVTFVGGGTLTVPQSGNVVG